MKTIFAAKMHDTIFHNNSFYMVVGVTTNGLELVPQSSDNPGKDLVWVSFDNLIRFGAYFKEVDDDKLPVVG